MFLFLWVCLTEIDRTGTPFYAPQHRFSDTVSFLLMEFQIVFMLWIHCLCGQWALVHPVPADSTAPRKCTTFTVLWSHNTKFTSHESARDLSWIVVEWVENGDTFLISEEKMEKRWKNDTGFWLYIHTTTSIISDSLNFFHFLESRPIRGNAGWFVSSAFCGHQL